MNILPFPNRIVLELTPLCNLSCSMCPRHIIEKNSGYMCFTLWEKLIDEIATTDPDAIVLPFWRGESLLHKEFISFSKYALEKKLRLHISTNGHFVKGEKAQILAQYEFITFSIHTIEGFENAMEFVKTYKSEQNTIQISFVDCEKELMPYLEKVTSSDDLLGFDSVRLYEEHTKDGKFGYSGKTINQERFFCPKLENTLVISYDGSISRCNHIWNTEAEDVNNKSIQDAWNSTVLSAIRENYPDKLCMPCDQWSGNTNGKRWSKTILGVDTKEMGNS